MAEEEARSEHIPNHSERSPNSEERFGTVKEAANAYNLSERVVLKRLQNGQIIGKKDGKAWLVCLPEGAETSKDEKADAEHVRNDSEHRPPYSESIPNALQGLVEHQAQEIAFLRSELTAQRGATEQEREQERSRHAQEIARRDVAEAELRRLLLADRQEIAQLRQQLAIVAAPISVETTPDKVVETAVQDALQDTHSEAIGAGVNEAMGRVDAAQRQAEAYPTRKWWAFWKKEM